MRLKNTTRLNQINLLKRTLEQSEDTLSFLGKRLVRSIPPSNRTELSGFISITSEKEKIMKRTLKIKRHTN